MLFSKKRLPLWRGLTAVCAVFLVVFAIGSAIAEEQKAYIDQALGTKSTSVVTEKSDEDLYTYKSDYKNSSELIQADAKLGERIAEEGSVLLKNKDNALPLANTENKVSLVGKLAYKPILGGMMGSGASDNSKLGYPQITLKAALEEQKATVNPDLAAAYEAIGRGATRMAGSFGMTEDPTMYRYHINEVKRSELEAQKAGVTDSFGEYDDVAIVVIGRISSEGRDYLPGPDGVGAYKTGADGKPTSEVDPEADKGARTALGLSNDERDMIALAKEKAQKVVVLVNSNSTMEIEELKTDEGVDAILWIGTPGVWGMRGVVNVLYGEASPSGHLPDTYAVDTTISPAMMNYGLYVWGNKGDISIPAGNYMGVNYDEKTGKYDNIRAVSYEVEAEGIYVGYLYYETRYADSVLNPASNASAKAGAIAGSDGWSYNNEVSYGFGYGLSYTTFEQTLNSLKVDKDAKTVTAEVTVKNTGNKPGKDAVQLYVSQPYTAYDRENDVEKAAIQLLDFGKTEEIAPGNSVTVRIEADMKYMASYDANGAGTYILDEGDYYFAIGNGAHEALNNVLAAKGKTTADGMTANGDASKTEVWNHRGLDTTTFSTSKNGVKIKNQLENADLNYYKPGTVTYLSRRDWEGTWPKTYSNLYANEAMIKELRNRKYEIQKDQNVTDTFGEKKEESERIRLAGMKGAAFDDPRWFYFLNQITLEEAVGIIELGGNATWTLESIDNPVAKQADGPNGFNSGGVTLGDYTLDDIDNPHYVAADDPNKGYSFGTMPNAPMVAATFSKEIAREFGRHIGNQSLWIGSPIIWAGGANQHRSPYAGRTHEYYSEDPVLSAMILTDFCAGGKELGCILAPKHFAFNDFEINRYGLSEFMTEQKAREGDLRCFQGAFEDAECLGVMTAFNRIGVSYINGHEGLMQNILRKEWGFKGIAGTDMVNNAYLFQLADSIMGGVTMMANSRASNVTEGGIWEYCSAENIKGDAKLCAQLRKNMHYQWYAYANSNLLNGMNESTRTISHMTWWRALLISGIVVFSVAAAAGVAMYAVTQVKSKKEENA